MVDSQRGAPRVVGFNPTSASGIIILLEQSGKDKGLLLFTCHTSIKTVNYRTDCMNEKSKIAAMNTSKTSLEF